MMADHNDEIERHERIAELTNDYTAPEGAEPEYVKALADLRHFRDNLLEHIFVENEVIFPRALMME
jgi:iron-sulfur cluster repair di-iron protein